MPRISVLIVCYEMEREIPRTVHSFLPPYQKGIAHDDVEILVLDNGSPRSLPERILKKWDKRVRYIPVPNAPPSPAYALNYGAQLARGDVICPVIDGARMASPGLLHWGMQALKTHGDAFVATVGFHLGEAKQQLAVTEGYNQAVEDELLESVNWPDNGYRLFEICAPAGSGSFGWFSKISESNAPLLSKEMFERLGGFDTRFDFPGGGIVNLDFFSRALADDKTPYLMLMGEGTFHQFHGGVTTSKSVREIEDDGRTTLQRYRDQYKAIRGQAYRLPKRKPVLYGHFPAHAAKLGLKTLQVFSEEIDKNAV